MYITEIDKISFGCLKSELEDYLTTVIYINGVDLKRIIEGMEAEQMAKKGLNVCNGCYEGISLFIAFHNQDHFLGKTLKDYIYQDQWYTLYDYKYSGVPGDHSLSCKITFEDQQVVWHSFKNFSKIISFDLDYNNLEFRFTKEQYLEAIETIKNDSEKNLFA
ncbi:MAG: hypothetical protein AAGA43_05855 [Bacteroidota bacterium]